MPGNAFDEIDALFFDRKHLVHRLPHLILECSDNIFEPDKSKGVQFWITLSDSCQKIINKYKSNPAVIGYVCTQYDALWTQWKTLRDAMEENDE